MSDGDGLISTRLSSSQIQEASASFALLPVGACEQHGRHLPLDTDAMTASHIGEKVCRSLGGFLLPTLPFGTSAEHRGFPGTITLKPNTLAAIVDDVVASCLDFGLRRIVVLSGHGGNWILRPAVRDINVRHSSATVVLVPEWVLWDGGFEDDLHAGAKETSIVLHLDPAAVGDLTPDFVPKHPREALDVLAMKEISPSGIWGRPSLGDAAEGETFLAGAVERVTDYLRNVFNTTVSEREGVRTWR